MIDFTHVQNFHFLRPHWFFIMIVFYFLLRSFSHRSDTLKAWRKVMSPEILQSLTIKGNTKTFFSPQRLSLLLTIPLCFMLMGPTWRQRESPFNKNNSALIIALDVSESMEQSDLQPSRLLRAKQKILELLELRGDTKTALIAYSGSAHVVMPITNDRKMIRHFLDALDKGVMPQKGKIPQNVLPLAKTLLDPTLVPGTLLIVGDGSTQETANKFSEFFKEEPHQLIVWAIGKDYQNKIPKNSNIVPMQLGQLQDLTKLSKGRLIKITNDKTDVEEVHRVIETNLIVSDDKSHPWHDAGYPLVFIIAFIF